MSIDKTRKLVVSWMKISELLVSKALRHELQPDRKGHGVVLETAPPSTVRRKRS